MPDAIVLDGLKKRYGSSTALDGLDLVVPRGSVVGLLGPNGAGKTTTIRILATLLRPDGGRATIFGADVVRDARRVRASIGLTGQFSAVDEILTGAENLRMVGRLYRLSARAAATRADQLLEVFDLVEAAGRRVKTYSGGMRRRLDLAASLMACPRLLMLDEPTAGLDSRSRLVMWEVIGQLRQTGTTVLLTTQYLEEADRLSDSIAVIDNGRLVASGTPAELKSRVGGAYIELAVAKPSDVDIGVEALGRFGARSVKDERAGAAVAVDLTSSGIDDLPEMLQELRRRSITITDVAVRRPTLDAVFLRLTGRPAAAEQPPDEFDGDDDDRARPAAGPRVGAVANGPEEDR